SFEPNNSGGSEHYVHGWFHGGALTWNDIPSSFSSGFVVEFSPSVSIPPVPLPAGLPLILAGLGAFAALRWRQKTI
ncbi:MAG: VPLPA-CTERM sorting domain-containing protein, partial [Pseudomonadota bacterium]